MTSHQGPPIPLVGPYLQVSLAGGASPICDAHLQKHHDQSRSHVSEPDPKRRKTGVEFHEIETESINTPSSMRLGDNSMSTINPTGIQSGPAAGYSNRSSSKRSSLLPDQRPLRHSMAKNRRHGSNLAIERAAMRHDVQTKAYVPEPPNAAPRYQTTRPSLPDVSKRAVRLLSDTETADFSPWSGHHPEDILNESATRNGFYDKLLASHNESLTAKPSVLLSLKNKSGIQVLSALLSSALKQRERHNTTTAATTFKPPPRVTLTDTKKETWLRDLADSGIPLRRLSRTIPHGIRGRILLDHCLSKDIPISRAIWLVKCVGANEIRACKRKGTSGNFMVGGEAKWVKDWTVNVEQFLGSIIDHCGSEDWKASINYGLRLAFFIHAERLLDRDEYYKWLIGCLTSADLDYVPIWLLIMKTYRQDLLRYREYGILLVKALLMQLNHARKPANKLPYEQLFRELLKECRAVLADSPDCFLLPQFWNANKEFIGDVVISGDELLQNIFDDLTSRMRTLENLSSDKDPTALRSSEQKIVAELDGILNVPTYPKIASTCLLAARSGDELVKICLQWATSTFRCGRYRIYAAVRLLRIWHNCSIDLQKPILDFLALGKRTPNIDWADFYSLCAELVSSKHLSAGRYCQWLMARGALNGHRASDSGDNFEVQLLFELPLQHLPDHIVNLRRSLLFSIGLSIEQEDAAILTAQAQIVMALPIIFPGNQPNQESLTKHIRVHALSRTQKSAIANWIRQSVSSYAEMQQQGDQRSRQELYLRVGEEDFRLIRQLFEDLEEFGLFIDVLSALVTTAGNGALLAAIACTVNCHFDIFNSLGTAKHIFGLLFNQRKLLPSQETHHSSFTSALLDLGVRLPRSGSEVSSLRKDEALLNPRQSAAAPSPISENMLEAVHSDKTTFLEEMDLVLANGTSMDHATRTRCFESITNHLEKSWGEATPISCQYPGLLARLRAFDEKRFDILAAAWLETLFAHSSRPPLSFVFIPLICHDVCTLGVVLDRATHHRQNRLQEQDVLVALEMLEMLASNESENIPSTGFRAYRFLQQRRDILQTHLKPLVSLVHSCVKAAMSTNSPISTQALKLLKSDSVKSFMRTIVSQILIADKPITQHSSVIPSALRDILSNEWDRGLRGLTTREKVSNLLDSVSDLNKPLSQLNLEIILDSPSEADQHPSDTIAEVLLDKLTSAPQSQVILWSQLLSTLRTDNAFSVHGRIVSAIMSEISSGQAVSAADNSSNTEQLLEVAMATSSDIPDAPILPLIEQILERLSKLGSSLLIDIEQDSFKSSSGSISRKIHILLRLLAIHQTTMLSTKFSQSHLAQICLSLAYLYLHAITSSCTSLANHIFDVLAIISDGMTQDTRSQSVRTLLACQESQDPRIRYIFGDNSTCSGKDWLHLIPGFPPTYDVNKRHPHSLRHWEMMQDATPVVTENDTCLSLTLFATKKSVT